MGCASSNPLVEGGKNLMDNAKQATDNVIEMGEKAMHDAGDAVNTGIESVKNAVESGIQTAQNSIGAAVNNIEQTMGLAKNNVEETINSTADDASAVAEETMETISDSKTVLAFEDATSTLEHEIRELEDMEMEATKQINSLKDEFGETVDQTQSCIEETLNVDAAIDSSDKDVNVNVNVNEELPPTAWEAAADEILRRSFSFNLQTESLPPDFDEDFDVESIADSTSNSIKTTLLLTATNFNPIPIHD